MLEGVSIYNFRGISKGSVGPFAKVNVFVGRNNSGKSSVLEAIYLASAPFNPRDPLLKFSRVDYLLQRRSQSAAPPSSLWFNYDMERDIEIRVKVFGRGIDVIVLGRNSSVWPAIKIPDSIIHEAKRQNPIFDYIAFDPLAKNIINRDLTSVGMFDIFQKAFEHVFGPDFDRIRGFLSNTTFVSFGLLERFREFEGRLWSKILMKRFDRVIVDLLRDGYNVLAEDLTYGPVDDEFEMAVKLPQGFTRVNDLGDGARIAVLVAMVLLTVSQGIVLLEDIDIIQHPSGLYNLIKFMMAIVKESNLQLFLTVHSLDFLNILFRLSSDIGFNDIAVFFFERDKNGVLSVRRIEMMDKDVLDKLGLDIRFLDLF